ncbi:predicted protein [Micromonas commoda]|uniref:Large ribosomal subunit protein uL4c n=1 Tax=Micromonas commoda (strain RCC299 / NOUM17 / CCMP2709) TaxID=296587 RepID=C1E7J4_MICCC|nr:predicted protein [Micromonas commoda]ACO64343.1 predicted protein [Micromonas commoda]|eukprot:XP_002503085.1 predicted protein [Micromonas commoda]
MPFSQRERMGIYSVKIHYLSEAMASVAFNMSARAAVGGAQLKLSAQRKRVARAPLRVDALAAQVSKVSFDGASAGTATLDVKVAKPDVAKGLVHKYVVMVRQNARRGTASTLTKSEVRGGGRKPFKQKGTGNARAGSSRTPLKPGGGVVFGPKPKDWSIKMNKKERRLAMATAIQSAAAASSMIVVDSLAGAAPKTKAMATALKSWGVAEGEKAYIITKDAPEGVTLSTRNMARVVQTDIKHLNVYDVLNADKVVVEESALQYINDFYGESGAAWA